MNQIEPRRLLTFTIPAAIIAALLGWLIGESKPMWVQPETRKIVTMGTVGWVPTTETTQAAERATAARVNAVFGGLLGLSLGLAGGLATRSPRRGIIAGLLGMVGAALVGFGVSYAVIPLFHRFRDSLPDDMLASMIMHGAIWTSAAMIAGLALGLSLGRGVSRLGWIVLEAFLGATMGTVVFDVAGSILATADRTGEPVSASSMTRLAARLLIAVSVAIGASLGCKAWGKRGSKRDVAMPTDGTPFLSRTS